MNPDQPLPAEVAGEVASVVLPGVGPLVSRMFTAVRDEWNRNRSVSLRAAEQISGLTRENLAEKIETQPELVPLVTRLLWEAAMTGQGELLEAMGAAFGAAIADVERITDYELILGGLRNLRGEDVRVLRQLRERPAGHLQGADRDAEETTEIQTVVGIAVRLALPEEAVAFGLVRLASQGFAVSLAAFGGNRFEITELGRLLYDVLERLSAATD